VTRRRVTCSQSFLAAAKQLFPEAGTSGGRPSFELFEAGPLQAAKVQFERQFDDLPDPGVPIKAVMTTHVPLFGPLVFYGVLVRDDVGTEVVEIVDVIIDPDYLDLVGDDPPE
jgi:hypothetical protein